MNWRSAAGRFRPVLVGVVFGLAACTTSGFQIERVASASYGPSTKVELIRRQPQRPYVVLAKFSGAELALCARTEPYCGLRAQARALGANAVWVQAIRHWTRPEQWVEINGRMTRIPASQYESIAGVLIRYRD